MRLAEERGDRVRRGVRGLGSRLKIAEQSSLHSARRGPPESLEPRHEFRRGGSRPRIQPS